MAESRRNNPVVGYTREQLLGSEVAGEDYVTLNQTVDLSGRKGLARKAAAERQRAAEHRNDARELELEATVRLRFHLFLHAQERGEVLTRWQQRVESQVERVAARQEAGDATAYDRLRLERELARVESLVARERAANMRAWARLHALIDPGGEEAARPPRAIGVLLPDPPPADHGAMKDAANDNPEFRALDSEGRALALEQKAGSRWWIPSPNIGAGYKGVDLPGGGRAHGFVVSLGVPLPIFDRGRSERVGGLARAQSLNARTALSRDRTRGDASALWHELETLVAAAQKLEAQEAPGNEALLRAAESAYRGGEIGIMELLDAYRSASQASLDRLAVSMDARRAEIDLARRTGGSA
jgi:cobalt-zinc-cadmium efflux system outer membrane protein